MAANLPAQQPGASAQGERADALRRANVRTALVLLSIAVVFFVGVIAARVYGGLSEGMSMLGFAVLLFLVLAIGRNIFGKR
jgi:hypothetical protein